MLTLLEQPMAWLKIFHFSYFRQFLTQALIFYSFYFPKRFFHICIHYFLLALILYPFSSNSYRFHLYLLQLLPNLYYMVYILSLKNVQKEFDKKYNLSSKPFCRLFAGLLSKFKPLPLVFNFLKIFFGFLDSHKKVAIYKMIACHHWSFPASTITSDFPA